MLPKHSRLTKQSIEKNLTRARKLRTARFLVIYSNVSTGNPQISITVSKKVAPTAVSRNTLRRKGYVAVRPLIPLMKEGSKVLISCLSLENTAPIGDITQELKKAFIQLGILT